MNPIKSALTVSMARPTPSSAPPQESGILDRYQSGLQEQLAKDPALLEQMREQTHKLAQAGGWLEWNDPRHLGQAPFREAGQVTYLYPGGLATGRIEFDSPFLSAFRVKTEDGRTVEGNSNNLGSQGNHLWISDPETLKRIDAEDRARTAYGELRLALEELAPTPPPPPPRPDFSSLDAQAARQGWSAYDPAEHHPDSPPFVTGARVAYACVDPGGSMVVVEGSASFPSRWEAGFKIRTDEGRTATGNTNEVASGYARLWTVA